MAITTQEQQNIIGLTVGLFNAAPGAQYLEELTAVYEANGNSLEALVNYILTTDAFNAQYASAQSDEDVIAIAVETFGVDQDSEAFAEASAFFANGLAAGRSAADLLIEAANYLNGDVDPQFADIAAQFQNKIAVATYFSVERDDIEELDVAALKAVVAGVTADEESVQAAIDAVEAEYGEAPVEPASDLTAALAALQGANDARTEFLQEEALASELIQAELADAGEEFDAEATYSDEEVKDAVATAFDAAEEAAGDALDIGGDTGLEAAINVLNNFLDADSGLEDTAPNVGAFEGASRTIQDTLIAETQEALTNVTTAVEDAVATVTGLSGRISTLQARKVELETALDEQISAGVAVTEQIDLLAAVDGVTYQDDDGDTAGDRDQVASIEVDLGDGDTATYTVADGEWSYDGGAAFSGQAGLEALLVDYVAATQARLTAQDLFEAAIDRVVEAENEAVDTGAYDAAVDVDYTITGDEVTISMDGQAPLSLALINLRDAQAEIDTAVANLGEARELVDTLAERDQAIVDASDFIEAEFGLEIQDLNDLNDVYAGTADNDLFLFNEERNGEGDLVDADYTINQFGEIGQDHIFFGDTSYQLVALEGRELEGNRIGNAEQLEVFWEQEGANLVLYVESEAGAGTDLSTDGLTTVTITEFSAENVLGGQLNDGLLSTNTTPVEIA